MLKISNLSKNFDQIHALKNISLEVNSGQIFSLIGPNGSGKTTLVKIMTGLIQATSGEVIINGYDIKDYPQQAKASLAYIPDDPQVWDYITGYEFLYLSGILHDLEESQLKKRIQKLLKIYNLVEIENYYFQNYSRGNKQKFSILAALLHEPKLLIIDEPIVGLDPQSVVITKNLFKDYVKAGGTIFMVTHQLDICEQLSTHFALLKLGQIIATGTLADLKKQAKIEKNAHLEEIYLKLT